MSAIIANDSGVITASATPLSARSTAKEARPVAQPFSSDEIAQPKTAVLSRLRRGQVSESTPHTGAATAMESACSRESELNADGPSCRSASNARNTECSNEASAESTAAAKLITANVAHVTSERPRLLPMSSDDDSAMLSC